MFGIAESFKKLSIYFLVKAIGIEPMARLGSLSDSANKY